MVARGSPIVRAISNDADFVEVEEDQGIFVDEDRATDLSNGIAAHVPGSEPAALVAKNVHPTESGRPFVEVLLVGEARRLEPEVAPLYAAVVPPVEAGETVRVSAESEELDVEDAVDLVVAQMPREAMRNDKHRIVAELLEKRLGIREEEEVGVEVRDLAEIRAGPEHEKRQRRGRGAAVFERRPVCPRGGELAVE